jgi:hypothetical protein
MVKWGRLAACAGLKGPLFAHPNLLHSRRVRRAAPGPGAAEVRLQPDGATITAHGAPGQRTIGLPPSYRSPYHMDYAGPQPGSDTLTPRRVQ